MVGIKQQQFEKAPSKSLKVILYTASSFKYFVIKNISELLKQLNIC